MYLFKSTIVIYIFKTFIYKYCNEIINFIVKYNKINNLKFNCYINCTSIKIYKNYILKK